MAWCAVGTVSAASYPANPSLAGDALCVAQSSVSCFDLGRLQPRWTALQGFYNDAPTVTEQALLVGGSNGLNALDPDSGELLWRLSAGTRLFSPSASDGVAYVGGEDGSLRAIDIDISPARVLWQRRFDGWVYPPAIAGARLIVGGQALHLYGLDRGSGRVHWRLPLSQELVYRPVVADETMVIVTLFSGEVLALDPADGRLRWRIRDTVANSSPLVAGGQLYFPTLAGTVKARAAADGHLLWQSAQRLSSLSLSSAAGRLFGQDSSAKLVVLDAATGKLLGRRTFGTDLIGSPWLLADQRLVLFGREPGSLSFRASIIEEGVLGSPQEARQ